MDLLRLGSLQGNLGDSLAGLEVKDYALQRAYQEITAILQNQGLSVSRAQLMRLATRLQKSQSKSPENLVTALEGEILRSHQASLSHSRPCQVAWGRLALRFPYLRQREYRLFKNEELARLERARSSEPIQLWTPDRERPSKEWLQGKQCWLRSPFVGPPPERLPEVADTTLRQAFLHLYVHLLLYRSNHEQWPVDLEELLTQNYSCLAPLDLRRVDYHALGDTMDIQIRDQPDLRLQQPTSLLGKAPQNGPK